MEKRIHKASRVPYAAAILMCLTLLSGSLVAGLYAKFSVGGSGDDSARVAAFVFDVQDEEKILDLSSICKPGDTKSFSFQVSNKRGTGVSEVDETYTVKFQKLGSLPLDYELSGTGVEVLQATGTFSAALEGTQSYTLTVTWPQEKRDAKYSSGSGVESLSMEIVAQQID